MSHKILRPVIVKVSVLGVHFPLLISMLRNTHGLISCNVLS